MKNTTKQQIESAANAAHVWETLSNEEVFAARYGRTIADWEYSLNIAILHNRLAIGSK